MTPPIPTTKAASPPRPLCEVEYVDATTGAIVARDQFHAPAQWPYGCELPPGYEWLPVR